MSVEEWLLDLAKQIRPAMARSLQDELTPEEQIFPAWERPVTAYYVSGKPAHDAHHRGHRRHQRRLPSPPNKGAGMMKGETAYLCVARMIIEIHDAALEARLKQQMETIALAWPRKRWDVCSTPNRSRIAGGSKS
jgi:hypothetical protein